MGEILQEAYNILNDASKAPAKPDKQWKSISKLKYKLGYTNQRLMNYILSRFPDYKDRVTQAEVKHGKLSVLKKLMTNKEKWQLIKILDQYKKNRKIK